MANKFEYDIGIIGGGAAGLTVAAGAAQFGAKTILIEREPLLGGDCLHYGCVPSKTLIKSAKVYHHMKQGPKYGLPEISPPPVDMSKVSQRIKDVIETIQVHDSYERFCGLGVDVQYGAARFVDEHTVAFGERKVTAKYWVIATGSVASAPPIPGLEGLPYWTNMDVFSLQELPETLTVLGGGPIACEMAQSFARLGSNVTMIQRSAQILSKEDADMAQIVQDSMEADGIRIVTGSTTKSVNHADNRFSVEVEVAGQSEVVRSERLLVAMGRKPSIETLGLEAVGVETNSRGVVVDNRLRTTQKHIFAAGDVTGRYQFTHAAGYEGGIVLTNTIFRLPRKVDYTWFPWCTYTEPELAGVGMNEKAAKAADLNYKVWEEPFKSNDRALAEGAPEGKIKLLLSSKDKPLGVQICGMHAGDLMGEWIAALNAKAGISTLASSVHAYPTLAEVNKRICGNVLGEKIFSDKVKKVLNFLFDYRGRACTLENSEKHG